MKPIALIACCSQKLEHPAPARELYCSDLFKKQVAWAELYCQGWSVVSAKYGLVQGWQTLVPYDLTLAQFSRAQQQAWAQRVAAAIGLALPACSPIILLAGRIYRRDLVPLLELRGFTVEVPLAGLGIGQQKAWLKAQTKKALHEGA